MLRTHCTHRCTHRCSLPDVCTHQCIVPITVLTVLVVYSPVHSAHHCTVLLTIPMTALITVFITASVALACSVCYTHYCTHHHRVFITVLYSSPSCTHHCTDHRPVIITVLYSTRPVVLYSSLYSPLYSSESCTHHCTEGRTCPQCPNGYGSEPPGSNNSVPSNTQIAMNYPTVLLSYCPTGPTCPTVLSYWCVVSITIASFFSFTDSFTQNLWLQKHILVEVDEKMDLTSSQLPHSASLGTSPPRLHCATDSTPFHSEESKGATCLRPRRKIQSKLVQNSRIRLFWTSFD
jgi:hypothetical protein